MHKTPITIEELLEAKEGEQYQFKEAKRHFDSNEAARCCCALANCGGGRLVFGITDKRPRKVVGSEAFDQPERTRKGLMDKLKIMVDCQILYQGNSGYWCLMWPAAHLACLYRWTAWPGGMKATA